MKNAVNLYSVRELDEPMAAVLERVADAGYDGVQFSGGLRGADPVAVAATLDDLGLETTAAHVDVGALRDDPAGVRATYRDALGCDGAVIPWLGPERWADEAALADTVAEVNALDAAVRDADWALHYHNHAHEFDVIDDDDGDDAGGETAFERFLAETTVGLELDVGWARVGGVDPAAFIESHGERVDVVHMKDMRVADESFREIGEGDVDMRACAAAAADADASWLVYEHDEPTDPAASIEAGAAFLDAL